MKTCIPKVDFKIHPDFRSQCCKPRRSAANCRWTDSFGRSSGPDSSCTGDLCETYQRAQKTAERRDLVIGTEYSYFSHRACEYFPCHPGADPQNFNCLFCFCPLYPLGRACGGGFVYLPDGRKDCSGCLYPHLRENYGDIIRRCGQLSSGR